MGYLFDLIYTNPCPEGFHILYPPCQHVYHLLAHPETLKDLKDPADAAEVQLKSYFTKVL